MSKKIDKIIKTITEESGPPQKPAALKKRSILQCDTLETLEQKQERLAKAFTKWCADIRTREQSQRFKRAYRLSDFRLENNITRAQWDEWITQKNNGFAEAIAEGKEYLGAHLWAGMAEGSLSYQAILRDLHNYSQDFVKNDQYEDKRKQDEEAAKTHIVVLKDFPSTDVPPCKTS